jgi:uncharacterized protein DUF6496
MPEKETIERARKDLKQGKSPSTAAGEFVRQEIHHVREGKHGVKNAKQAIAIGLSEARRAGVPIPDKPGSPSRKRTAPKAKLSSASSSSPKRARASLKRLKKLPHSGASHRALSRHAHEVAPQAARTRAKNAR